MGYSKEVFEEVQKKLYKIRNNSWEELARKKEILYKRFPAAEEIEKKLASTALGAARAVLSGNNSKAELTKLREKNKILREKLREILVSIDLPEDYLEVSYNCKKCGDEGFIDGIMCDCMKDMLRKESYNRLNKMSPFELSSFDNFSLDYYSDISPDENTQSPRKRMSLILNFCKKYAENFSRRSPGLLLTGGTGLGKTHLSLSMAREIINKGFGVIYGSTQNIVSKIENEKFRNYQNGEESEKHYIDCDLLILDDLGTEYSTAFSSAAIYNIVNSRIMMSKPTIISTNLSMKDMEKSYTYRMVSRIIGNNIRLEFLGSDIRQKMMMNK